MAEGRISHECMPDSFKRVDKAAGRLKCQNRAKPALSPTRRATMLCARVTLSLLMYSKFSLHYCELLLESLSPAEPQTET
jgi:hypothetical protein